MKRALARLRIMSDSLRPGQITALVGLIPDKTWEKGDLRAKTRIVEREHGWEISSSPGSTASLDEQVLTRGQRALPEAQ